MHITCNKYAPQILLLLSITYPEEQDTQLRRGVTLIFSYTRRLGPFLGVQKFQFQYVLGVFREMNIFGGMKILLIFWGVYQIIGLYLRVISMHFMVFSFGQGT